MTTQWPAPPPRPGNKIRHSWRCTRQGPILETLKPSPTGQCYVVEQCSECGHDDMSDRIERKDTP